MTAHHLDPLLCPRSVAIVGASRRQGSAGHGMVAGLRNAGFDGGLYPVNPRYDEIEGLTCYPSLGDLPESVDLAVLGVNSTRMERHLDEAIAAGARSAVIFDTCYLDGEKDRGLLGRLKAKSREAAMPVCGGNGMGYINLAQRIPVTLYDASDKVADGGNVAFVTHSGTVFSEIGLNDFRYRCNLVVSCGQEINATMADYIDYAVAMPSTRVIALFIEEARDPEGFVTALARARERDIPVVAMKVGRSAQSRRFARIHSNADSGDDRAYQAVFDRFGVLRVGSIDEMANLLTLLSHDRPLAPGGLGVVLDSGGEREMLTDLAEETGVPFAEITRETAARLRPHLHHALEPVNPLDAWGTAANFEDDFEGYFGAMAMDPGVAAVVFCGDFHWNPDVERGYAKALIATRARTGKPLAALINTPMSGLMTAGKGMTEHGVMALCGTREGLHAIRHALAWRDRAGAPRAQAQGKADPDSLERLHGALGPEDAPGETDSRALIAALGMTAASDGAGDAQLTVALLVDSQFGPLIAIRSAGVPGAALEDAVCCLPGADETETARLIDRLVAGRVLRHFGADGERAVFARLVARLSVLLPELASRATSIDIGPIDVVDGRAVCRHVTLQAGRATP